MTSRSLPLISHNILIQYINETFDDLSQICSFECDSNIRGTGQIRVLRSEDETIGNYTVFSLKDLSVEVHLQKSILLMDGLLNTI